MPPRRRGVRRATPNIEYGLQGGTIGAIGEVFDFNLRGILQADDNPRHYETVMLSGILSSSAGLAVFTVLSMLSQRGGFVKPPLVIGYGAHGGPRSS